MFQLCVWVFVIYGDGGDDGDGDDSGNDSDSDDDYVNEDDNCWWLGDVIEFVGEVDRVSKQFAWPRKLAWQKRVSQEKFILLNSHLKSSGSSSVVNVLSGC